MQFHDPEGRGELDERGHLVGLDLERKARLVGERAAGIVLEPRGDGEREREVLREGSLEGDTIDEGDARIAGDRRAVLRAVRVLERDRLGIRAGDRRAEIQGQGQERDATPIALDPLAGEARPKLIAYLEGQRLVLFGGDAGLRGHALAPHEPHVGGTGKTPLALQDDDGRVLALDDGPQTLRIGFGFAASLNDLSVIPEEIPPPLDDRLTLLARDEPHTHALGDPLDGAMDVLFYGRRDGHGIEPEHEDLLLVDVARAVVGRREPHRGPAGRERERLCAGQGLAVQGLELGLEGEGTAHPGRQLALEVVNEITRIHPAPLARLRAVDGERLAEPRIPERHHRLAEARRHLPHALDRALRRERLDLLVRQSRQERLPTGGRARADSPVQAGT